MKGNLERVRPPKVFVWTFSEDSETKHLQLYLSLLLGLAELGSIVEDQA